MTLQIELELGDKVPIDENASFLDKSRGSYSVIKEVADFDKILRVW